MEQVASGDGEARSRDEGFVFFSLGGVRKGGQSLPA